MDVFSRAVPVAAGVPVPHRGPHGLVLALGTPRGAWAVPAGRGRLLHADEQELDHVALAVALVGRPAMPDVVVHDRHASGWHGQRHLLAGSTRLRRVEVVAAGHQGRGPHLQGSLLGVVHGEGPPGAVASLGEAVLVQRLPLAAGWAVVDVPVRVHVVAIAEDARHGSVDRGVGPHLANS